MREDFKVDRLKISLIAERSMMGDVAAKEAADLFREILKTKKEINIIFASSPYLMDVYRSLLKEDVDWNCINAFHMDEYIGISNEHKASFANFLRENFFNKVNIKNVFYMDGMNDPEQECERYAKLLSEYPVDISFMGIGTNGHLAFNDPYLADFFDSESVIINPDMDSECRQQQVMDGWFKSIDEIPKSAITITIPGLLKAPYTITAVPGEGKKEIIKKVLEGPVCVDVPATAIRLHKNSRLFIDNESAKLLKNS